MRQIEGSAERVAKLVVQRHSDRAQTGSAQPGAIERGGPRRVSALEEGRFNSPHGVAVDPGGSIYVAEWLIGGRYVKLARER